MEERAFAERDMAMLQRDAALAEYNSAIQERDEAMAILRLRVSSGNDNSLSPDLPGNEVAHGALIDQQQANTPEAESSRREILTITCPQTIKDPSMAAEPEKLEQTEEDEEFSGKPVKSWKASSAENQSSGKDVSRDTSNVCKSENDLDDDENLHDQQLGDWKDNLELNQINFDDFTMQFQFSLAREYPSHATSGAVVGGSLPAAQPPCQCIHYLRCLIRNIPELSAER